jgi:methyltransferase (TIGR00027 family)
MAIENISDTALWVAVYRAMETERPDAHFRDPLAKRLAGEKGMEIVRKMPHGKGSAWAMIVRTSVMDDLILKTIKERTDTVINLAAGLDTRPYRLPLPSSLRWIEVDLPEILSYKEEHLKDEKPVCRLERIRMDLANVSERQKLFQQIGSASKQVLVITEGLLVYLSREQVGELSKDLSRQPNFKYWLMDLTSPVLLKLLQRWYGKRLKEGGVRMQFAPEEGADYFRPFGWEVAEFRSMLEESRRLNRTMPGAWLWNLLSKFYSKEKQEGFRKAGVYLFKRAD